VLIIAVVAVLSFIVAQVVIPEKNAVTQRDLNKPPRPAAAAQDHVPEDFPSVTSGGMPAAASAVAPTAAPVAGSGQAPYSKYRITARSVPLAAQVPDARSPVVRAPVVQVSAAVTQAPDTAGQRPRPRIASPLRVERAAVCTLVYERAPRGESETFSASIPHLYYFTHIVGARDTAEIVHRWYRDGKLVQVNTREVRSASWRTHTRLVLEGRADAAGSWRVDVSDKNTGAVLESRSFVIQ
jgi:hypothetical protein